MFHSRIHALGQSQLFSRAAALIIVLLGGLHSGAQSFQVLLQTNLFQPSSLLVTPQNRYIISDAGNHRIVEFNPDSGAFRVVCGGQAGAEDSLGAEARLRNPQGVIDTGEYYLIADTGNHLIRKLSYTGQLTTVAGDYDEARLADDEGRFPFAGAANEAAGLQARFSSPSAMVYDSATQSVYIADSGNGRICKLDLATSQVTTLVQGLTRPSGLSLGKNGVLYFVDSWRHSIYQFDPASQTQKLLAGRGSAFDSGLRDSSSALQALFKMPTSIFYRESKDELIVADTGNGVIRRIFNIESGSPAVETYANSGAAGFISPVSVTRETGGMFLVLDGFKHTLTGIITVQTPRLSDPKVGWIEIIIDADTGIEVAVLRPVTDATFRNDVTIAISGDPNGVHHFTAGPGPTNPLEEDRLPVPTESSPTAPKNFISPSSPSQIPQSLANPMPVLKVKAVTTGREDEERVPSRVIESTFRFQAGTPVLDARTLPGAVIVTSETSLANIWYTLDGSEPVNNPALNPNVLGPLPSGASFPLVIKSNVTVKAKAFRANYQPSATAIAEFTPTNYVPNRISLGFEYGEASSDFVGSPGQRFYAPVTLSLLPNSKAYGLQFNVSVQPENAPVIPPADYKVAFQSMLTEQLTERLYQLIPNAAYVYTYTNYITNYVNETNFFLTPEPVDVFTNMLFTNINSALVGVGWVERAGQIKLYDTTRQHLLSYSQPHDTIFRAADGKVVPGGFSFIVPKSAQVGNTYLVQVDRPSATADGVAQDIYIEAPDLESDSPVKAVRRLAVGQRRYIAGDVVPFRWFNAGDFGDTNILNNDITQLHQTIVYNLNMPPPGSDLADAMDTCCLAVNGTDLSHIIAHDGNDLLINSVALGDGRYEINDLYVAFRRALDPTLVWYARYWKDGQRTAEPVPNSFRGEQAAPPVPSQLPPPPLRPGSILFSVGEVSADPGQTASIPVYADVQGEGSVRMLLLNLKVKLIDGPALQSAVSFTPNPSLGAPTLGGEVSTTGFAGAWLNLAQPLTGRVQLGTLQVPVPESATDQTSILVSFEKFSASPNGIGLIPASAREGLIMMRNRAARWNDQIPDLWRVRHFGSLLNLLSHADADADGDGRSNLEEFLADTIPTDRRSGFAVRAARRLAGKLALRLPTVAGQRYVLEGASSLSSNTWTVVESEITGTGEVLELVPQSNGASHEFFRVRLAE